MDSARAQMLAAREHLQQHGWVSRRSEAFHHLPPPPADQWLGTQPQDACQAAPLDGSGWTLQPVGGHPGQGGVDARWLDALDPAQRSALFAGLPVPGDGEDAPFVWAHRALCRQGLRLSVPAAAGRDTAEGTVWLHLHHRSHSPVEAPMLVIDLAAGARCVLIETHERDTGADACQQAVTQNLQAHVHLGTGAQLQHLRIAAPAAQDQLAHHVHAVLDDGAQYSQALVATEAAYHLQRNTVQLRGKGAHARHAGLLLAGGQQIDQQVYTDMRAPQTTSQVEILTLASGKARVVANAYTRIAPGSTDADVHQRLSGIPLSGQPRLIMRPHLEILHDQVQAEHGATWGALPEDALFYARQRGLDEVTARALIIQGMAHAVLSRSLEQPEDNGLLSQWLEGGWLVGAIERHLQTMPEVAHG